MIKKEKKPIAERNKGMMSMLINNASGRKYSKTGDLSGDLCCKCYGFMIIYKLEKKNTLRCQECGREVQFETDALERSAYK